MHVSGFPFDLYSLLQFIFTALIISLGLLHLVKTTASKYFLVDANFEEVIAQESDQKSRKQMIAVASSGDGCAVCGNSANKKCSGCKIVRYCSATCQSKHWKAGHRLKCKELKLFGGLNAHGDKASVYESKSSTELQQLKKVLFPYEEFVKLFNWENIGFPPCGLLNCGNSCFANVVLQCLSCTRPLIAYLLEIGHRKRCRRNDWCFLCELQTHVERAKHSWQQPFSPINILSRLPNIGGNLGYGKQEDAHEFMRFAIDTMQSVCLDEFGGEKALHPSSQETTLIQYIFGGHLQSQVKCTKCSKISYRYENMMDLTVEIHGDAESLEECLNQFTAEEWLDGENMYKCDGCNDYVKACKRLTIHHAPNILTVALKRFQSGRFGKLNKRVTFPETLDLGPYMSEPGQGTDLYQLYAVVVHVDMLNASFFGHYICYTKDLCGNWYRIDDCKVTPVELEEVLTQGAYMLLYSRTCVRPSCVKPLETLKEKRQAVDLLEEAQQCLQTPVESITIEGSINSISHIESMPTDVRSPTTESSSEKEDSVCMDLDDAVKVHSVFDIGDPLATSADNSIEGTSRSLDMVLDGPIKVNLTSSTGDQQDLDSGNPESSSVGLKDLDDCVSKHSDAADIASSAEIFNGGVLNSVALSEASPVVEAHSMDCEVLGTNSDECSFDLENRARGNRNEDSLSKELSMADCLSSQSDVHEMPETSCSLHHADLNSVTVNLQEGNSSSFRSQTVPMLEPVIIDKSVRVFPAALNAEGKDSKSAGDKFCSQGRQRSPFSPGFLDKCTRYRSPNRNGKFQVGSGEVGKSCEVRSNCNGNTKPGVPHQDISELIDHNGTCDSDNQVTSSFTNRQSEKRLDGIQITSVESGKGKHAARTMELISSDVTGSASCSRLKFNPLFSPGFVDKQTIGKSQNRNGNSQIGPGEVSPSCTVNNCNGFANHGSFHQNGRQPNNHDETVDHDILLQSPSSIEDQYENSCMDEDEKTDKAVGELGNPRKIHCNGKDKSVISDESKICNNDPGQGTFLRKGKDVFSPGFLNQPSRKKSLKKDGEGRGVSEIVSSNHDRNKLPRVG